MIKFRFNFFIIVGSTAIKILWFLQNLITLKQLKILLWSWQNLHCSILYIYIYIKLNYTLNKLVLGTAVSETDFLKQVRKKYIYT